MKREIINPWTWQEKYGFVHANKLTGADTLVFLAGQISVDENGEFRHADDMEGQLDLALSNVETVLTGAGMTFSQVVRLVVYTVDMEKMLAAHDHMAKVLGEKGCRHAGTLIGVTALAVPGALVEIEVTAAC